MDFLFEANIMSFERRGIVNETDFSIWLLFYAINSGKMKAKLISDLNAECNNPKNNNSYHPLYWKLW